MLPEAHSSCKTRTGGEGGGGGKKKGQKFTGANNYHPDHAFAHSLNSHKPFMQCNYCSAHFAGCCVQNNTFILYAHIGLNIGIDLRR